MSTRRCAVLTAVIVCLGVVALAQEQIPIRNWPAPPYWTPPAPPRADALADGREGADGPSEVSGLPTGPLAFVAVMPCRLVDTRFKNPQQPPPLATTPTLLLPLYPPSDQPNWPGPYDALSPSNYKARLVGQFDGTGNCGIPANAGAVSLNLTVVYPGSNGDVRIWPYGGTVPMVSTINVQTTTQVATNAVVVSMPTYDAASPDLSVRFTVYPKGTGTDLILDVNGYYAPQAVVNTLNTLSGNLTLAQGSNVTITPSGNTLTISSGGAGGTLPSGSANQTLRSNGSSWVAGSFLYNNGSRIGLGTTSPNQQLELTGNLRIPVTAAASGTPSAGVLFLGSDSFLHNYAKAGSSGQNTFVGVDAGNFTSGGSTASEGSGNTGIGELSLAAVTIGQANTATGYASLSADTTGDFNTAVGYSALLLSKTGTNNTALGYSTLSAGVGAHWNTAVGSRSLLSNTLGGNNTAVGGGSLLGNMSGDGNTAGGVNSLSVNIGGSYNTAFGYGSLSSSESGSYNTALGQYAGDVTGSVTAYGGGTVSLTSLASGSNNTFLGANTGATSAAVANCTAVGYNAYCTANDQVRLGSAAVTSIGGKVAWTALSDLRAKQDVRDLPLGLDFVMRLRPVQYELRTGNGRVDMGFVAQDIQALLGDGYNLLDIGGDPDRTLSLRHSDLIAPLVKAVQEQQAIIKAQQENLAGKDARIGELANRQVEQQTTLDAQQALIDALTRRLAVLEQSQK